MSAARSGRPGPRRRVVAGVLLGAAASLAGPLAAQEARPAMRPRTLAEDMTMFSQVLSQLRLNHPDSLDTHALMIAAIEGMLGAADPHSYVVVAARVDAAREKAFREGKLYPVPISFSFAGGSPVVVSVRAGTAAARADILPGDELVAVDGQPVREENAEALDLALAGEKKSPVVLTLERRRADGALVQLQRRVLRERGRDASSVPTAFLLDAETGYLRITDFDNDRAADEVHDAIGTLQRRGMRRLVLDLRDNGGGIVTEAAKVAGEFLPAGTLLYTMGGRRPDLADTGRVGRSFWSRERRFPVVVLVNAGTASAAELVAGALQDHDRAVIVGRPTFGKALVMRGFPLADGSVAMMVVGHARTPCGRLVQRSYRNVARHDYYRLSRAQRDTAGRPSCRTANGRTVYGGGGVYPDVVLPVTAPPPDWLAQVAESDLLVQWAGGHVSEAGAAYASADALADRPALAAGGLASFRALAQRQGLAIPEGAEVDARLERALVRQVAYTKFGDPGYYRVAAATDGAVREAVGAFANAEGILKLAGTER
ncbi:MAG TPA: S41 family peptidase [Gemmatimonadaceae bacterium]|nr:S41 family peptidase [Gemmatimonadaceae bacterium]